MLEQIRLSRDTVKRRMEAAYETLQTVRSLQGAAGLTQLSSTVEDVCASGDLPRAADTLHNMRHCLSAVGEVVEFANVRKQLEVLEDRLDTMRYDGSASLNRCFVPSQGWHC